jgi:hypothetical protein
MIMRSRIGPVAVVAFSGLVTCLALACGRGDDALSHSKGSPEELVEAVLAALEARDRAALEALLVTREEHRDLLWDELPERTYMSFEVARELNERNTRDGLTQALDRYGGQEFELIEIEFTDPPEVYETFTWHFGPRVRVRRVSDGREGELPILDVVLERNGRWKLMNFEE